MSTWYYYNEKGEKTSVTGGQLKWLAKNGKITPETVIETEDGKTAPARKVQGLTFATSIPLEPSPFIALIPAAAKSAENPFTAAMPIEEQTVPQNVPVSGWAVCAIYVAVLAPIIYYIMWLFYHHYYLGDYDGHAYYDPLIILLILFIPLISIVLGIVAWYDTRKRNLAGKKRAVFAIILGIFYWGYALTLMAASMKIM